MKKKFYSHIILLIEGRAFCVLMVVGIPYFMHLAMSVLKVGEYLLSLLAFAEVCLSIIFFIKYIWSFLWPLAWGKLIIDNEGVRWRCLFKKSIFLSWNECKYMGFETFSDGNVVKNDIYGAGFKYIYFSTTPYPKEFNGKINKLHCKDGFIKFFPANEKNLQCSPWVCWCTCFCNIC